MLLIFQSQKNSLKIHIKFPDTFKNKLRDILDLFDPDSQVIEFLFPVKVIISTLFSPNLQVDYSLMVKSLQIFGCKMKEKFHETYK